MGLFHASKGGVAGTVVDLKVVFAAALKARASSMIFAHNHPSGNLLPSQADLDLTKRFKEAGKILDIQVLDHLILSPDDRYYSFADECRI
jgi:DNA repair protein RadC